MCAFRANLPEFLHEQPNSALHVLYMKHGPIYLLSFLFWVSLWPKILLSKGCLFPLIEYYIHQSKKEGKKYFILKAKRVWLPWKQARKGAKALSERNMNLGTWEEQSITYGTI